MKRSTKIVIVLFIISGLTASLRYYFLPKLISADSPFAFSGFVVWFEDLSKLTWIGTLANIIEIGTFSIGSILSIANILASVVERQPENPFLLIRESSKVFPSLGYVNRIVLERRNIIIPYYNRGFQESLSEQIYDKLLKSDRLILLGAGGVGKSREMGEVAQLLVNEGYTAVLLMPHGDPILKQLTSWPSGWPRSNLLILIDDLHLLYKQKASIPSAPNEPFWSRLITSRSATFEERFKEFLESVEKIVPDYKLIATVRSNTEEWGIINNPRSLFWKKLSPDVFEIPSFTPKDSEGFLRLIADGKEIPVRKENILTISIREKFGSPRNIVRNIILAASHKRILTSENYIPTLQGSLSNILEEAEQRHPILKDLLGVIWHASANGFPMTSKFIFSLTSTVRRRFLIRSEVQPAQQAIRYLINRQLIRENGELLTADDAILEISKNYINEAQFVKALLRTSVFAFPVKYADSDAVSNYSALISLNANNLFSVLISYYKVLILALRSNLNATSERNLGLYRAIKRKIPILWKLQLASWKIINMVVLFLYIIPRGVWMLIIGSGIKAQQYIRDSANKLAIRMFQLKKSIIMEVDFSEEERNYEEEKLNKASEELNIFSSQIDAQAAMYDGLFEAAEGMLQPLINLDYKNKFTKYVTFRVLGYALAFEQKWLDALGYFDHCLSIYSQTSSNSISPMIGKAYSLLHLGRSEEAKELLDQIEKRGGRRFINWHDQMAYAGIEMKLGKQEESIKILRSMKINFNFLATINAIPEMKRMRHFLADKLGRPEIIPGAQIYSGIQKPLIWYVLYFLTYTIPFVMPFFIVTSNSLSSTAWEQTLFELLTVAMISLVIPQQYRKIRDLYFDDANTFIAVEHDRVSLTLSERRKIKKGVIRFNEVLVANEHFSSPSRLVIRSQRGVEISISSKKFQRYSRLREQLYELVRFEQLYPSIWEQTRWIYPFLPFVFLIYPTWFTAFTSIVGLIIGISLAVSDAPNRELYRRIINRSVFPLILYLLLLLLVIYLSLSL